MPGRACDLTKFLVSYGYTKREDTEMFEITKYDGNTGKTTVEARTNDAHAGREVANRENANRPHGSADSYSVRKAK